ncbi:hypothetical protein AURDEDRAFT_160419 [Auricularia subglabra TFB-10046 SS5]|nr:hypothetical protein AURDEDRAFT_160419 [Auricularia subglabra TFB-10046 SS5]
MRALASLAVSLFSCVLAAQALGQVFVEENNPLLIFSPQRESWNSNNNPQPGPNGTMIADYYHGGGYFYIDIAGASVTYTFNGTFIDLDGRTTRITTYSHVHPEGTPQVKLFETAVDPNVPNHVIKLTNLDNKVMGVDFFLFTPLPPAAMESSPTSTPSGEETTSESTPVHASTLPELPLSPNGPSMSSSGPQISHSHDVTEPSSTFAAPTPTGGTVVDPASAPESPSMSLTTIIVLSFASSLTLVLIVVVGFFCIRRRRQRTPNDAVGEIASYRPSPSPTSVSTTVPFLLHPTIPSGKGVQAVSIHPPVDRIRATGDIDFAMPPSYAEAHITQ